MLPSALLVTLAFALLSGCLAAESLYKVLGGESGLEALDNMGRSLMSTVGRDASDADIKKAYRVRRCSD